MDELIVKRLRGEATDIEIRQLDHWRAESQENEWAYRAFIGLWNETGEPAPAAVRPAPAAEEVVREANARRARKQARGARRRVLKSPWAAVGLTAAAAVLVLWMIPSDTARDTATPGLFPVESSTSPQEITTLSLSDGSVLRVTPETRANFPAAADRREVVLEGRAFFAVAENPIPFVVRTLVGEVIVHGTRFEVQVSGDHLRLVVVEGTVRLGSGGGAPEVRSGQVAYLDRGSQPRIVDHTDVWSVLEWPNGLLIFEATPLSRVAEELSRYFRRDVTVVGDTIRELRITAWFEDESMEEVVSAVCVVAAVPCEVGETEVTIGR